MDELNQEKEETIEVICDGCGKRDEGLKSELTQLGWCLLAICEFCPKCN